MNQLISSWHMHRMGMVDFWYYVDEEFYFKSGHMLLRGNNGSGKSVTMQSFIPLLLDGNKSSERLDSFGTRSRKIENYLLEETSDRVDRIGYLYMEFKRANSDVYKTIGMGLHARKGKPLDAWYFVIEDNQRVNRDFRLMDHNLAITKQMLKNSIGEQQVYDGQKAYMEKVNQSLFGFTSIDEYKEMITLLLQLRSPKLSNSLKPSIINDVLSGSLQPLSEDDLRPMSEAITNMDNLKDQLDALKASFHAAKTIHHIFEQYTYAVLFDKLHKYQKVEQQVHLLRKGLEQERHDVKRNANETIQLTKARKHAGLEKEQLLEEKKSLGSEDLLRLFDECQELRVRIKKDTELAAKKYQNTENKELSLQTIKANRKVHKDKKDLLLLEVKEHVKELDELDEELCFEEHIAIRNELFDHMEEPFDCTYTYQQIEHKLTYLKEGITLFQRYDVEQDRYTQILDKKAKKETEMEHLEVERKALEEQYDAMVEEYKESISNWMQANELLKISDVDFHTIMRFLQEYEEYQNYFEIYNIVLAQYQVETNKRNNWKAEAKENLRRVAQQVQEKEEELCRWQNKEDPQPIISDAQQRNRERLQRLSIPHRSFYSMLEFDDAMDPSLRNKVEEVCTHLGILDALLVETIDRSRILTKEEGMQDNYIFIDKDVTSISSQYLQGTSMKELEASLQAVLTSWGCKEYVSIHMEEHYFQSGIILGTLHQQQPSLFIGKTTRKLFRERKIAELTVEKKELTKMYDQVFAEVDKANHEIRILLEERDAFRKEQDLHLALQEFQKGEQRVDAVLAVLKEIKEEEQLYTKRLQELGIMLQEKAKYLSINAQKDVFLRHKEQYEAYHRMVVQIEQKHSSYLDEIAWTASLDSQVEHHQCDIDELRVEYEDLKDMITLHQSYVDQKQKQLDDMGYEDICQRIKVIEQRLYDLPNEMSEMDKRLGALENSIISKKEKIEEMMCEQKEQEKQLAIYAHVLKEEVELGYVELELHEDTKLAHAVMDKEKQMGTLKKVDDLKSDVQTVFYNNRGYLQEYHLTIMNDTTWDELENIGARLDISAKYKGMKVNFPQLLNYLQHDIELQSNLLMDSDRHLFEDILVNILSKKVRIRIQNSRSWVNHMNAYMNRMDASSSGLKLNLQWKSKKAESEEELDTKQLVEILEKDQMAVKEKDLERLSLHFRTKIANARKLQNMEENSQSFHQFMREIMDYRKWYEFKIMVQKTNETKKELTNTIFHAYSGGEKAMAMYVPLFSAVGAKYMGARDDAPHLIALDEAFAGVDEKNINNMFALIENFGFDYIMNSQILWGDYPAVSGIAIYELFRPENAHYVTIIPYEWNGYKKYMVER